MSTENFKGLKVPLEVYNLLEQLRHILIDKGIAQLPSCVKARLMTVTLGHVMGAALETLLLLVNGKLVEK
jgi:hypothetical protein